MSDAALVAREIQDLTTAVSEIAGAVRDRPGASVEVNVPAQPAPTVTVNLPEQPAAVVNVAAQEAPTVNVAPSSAEVRVENIVQPAAVTVEPRIFVEPAQPQAYVVQVTDRDQAGYIRQFVISPI